MALSDLVPALERSRRAAVDKSARVALQLIPGLKEDSTQPASSRVFYGLIGGLLGLALIALLGINIALSNDAVRIRELKLEVVSISEARESALREVTAWSTPENLAKRAKELGMVPSKAPIFLELDPKEEGGR